MYEGTQIPPGSRAGRSNRVRDVYPEQLGTSGTSTSGGFTEDRQNPMKPRQPRQPPGYYDFNDIRHNSMNNNNNSSGFPTQSSGGGGARNSYPAGGSSSSNKYTAGIETGTSNGRAGTMYGDKEDSPGPTTVVVRDPNSKQRDSKSGGKHSGGGSGKQNKRRSSRKVPDDPPNKKYSNSLTRVLIIVLILVVLLLLAAVIGVYLITKQHFQHQQPVEQKKCDFDYEDEESSSSDAGEPELEASSLRLPTNLSPTRYNWTLQTYTPYGRLWYDEEKNFTIDGELYIEFHCLEPTDVITVNQNGLNITEDTVEIWHSDEIMLDYFYLVEMVIDNEKEMVHFVLNGSLTKDYNYTIYMKYTGPINQNELKGLYVSSYTASDGTTRYITTSQMQPTDARRALPCFDEPQMKATFTITVIHPVGTVALSNAMENASYAIGGNWMLTDYKESPRMSSYLLAIVVSDFDYSEKIVNNVRFRVYARREVKDQTNYAIEVGPKVLSYFEQYFGSQFPLEKCDMIALPDFEAGAMENWGLITYREKYLLYDPQVYTLFDKQIVAQVIAHELAHMWFGNLVTLRWWDDLWLNEGFATFVEFIGTDHAEPTYHLYQQFVPSEVLGSMDLDQLVTSHPLYVPIEYVRDIEEVFDSISYAKGASVIRMIEFVLGKETFTKGLQYYLRKYKYANANNTELWEALSYMAEGEAKHPGWDGDLLNVTEFARSWTVQMGFPLLTVERKVGNLVTVTQERFKLDPAAEEAEKYREPEYGYEWYIPIWYRVASFPDERRFSWLTPDDPPRHTLTNLEAESWVIVNPDARAYYRIMYDQKNYDLLSAALKTHFPPFSVESRCQLLDDVFVLAKSDRVPYTTALQMTEYLEYEDNVLAWRIAMANLNEIATLLRYTPAYGHIRTYLANLLSKKYDFLGWKEQDAPGVLEERMEEFIVGAMCSLEHQSCYQHALNQFDDKVLRPCQGKLLSSSCNGIKPAFRRTVYCSAVRHGAPENWERMWHWASVEDNQVERQRIFRALSCTNEIWRLNWMLNDTIYANNVRKQDVLYIFVYASRAPIGATVMWEFFIKNWQKIYDDYHTTPSFMKYITQSAFARINDNRTISEVEKFRRRHPETRKIKAFDISLERSRANEKWMREHYDEMFDWFAARVKNVKDEL